MLSRLLRKKQIMSNPYKGPTLPTALAAEKARIDGKASTAVQEAVFANGCFWGTEHMYRKAFNDVLDDIKVGYAGGDVGNPTYKEVCTGKTNHAESVRIRFNPSRISYAELVEFHYRMHDPTEYNRQGPDVGTQYRSVIFTFDDEQEQIAKKVTQEVQDEKYKTKKIATQIVKFSTWWDAEDYHQRYLILNPHGYECPTHFMHW